MNMFQAIINRRTIRKFKQDPIPLSILKELVDCARYAPSAANTQPLKYRIIHEKSEVESVFPHTKWAAYIAPHGTPKPGEEPTAYIGIYIDTEIRAYGELAEIGSAAQNIFLLADEYNIGSCWIGSVNKAEINRILKVSERYQLHSVIALGYKNQVSIAEDAADSVRYYLSGDELHVPKRTLEEVLL